MTTCFCLENLRVVRHSAAKVDHIMRGVNKAREGAGLRMHAGKAVTHKSRGLVLGAEILGKLGWCSSERSKRAYLANASLVVVHAGVVPGNLMRRIVSGWSYCMLFRRPLMSLLSAVYKRLPPVEFDDYVYDLSGKEKLELSLCAVLSCCMCSNLRAQPDTALVCSDASMEAMASCVADIDTKVCAELWRNRERKGRSVHLFYRAQQALKQAGQEGFLQDLHEFSEPPPSFPF